MKRSSKRLQILLAVTLLLYACGYLTQFIGNYAVWQKNGGMPGGTSPPFPSLSPPDCLKGILWFPYNLYCIAGCAATVAAIFLYRKLFSQDALTDSERNFDFSAKGTYGTSGWMQPREIPAVLDMVSDLSQHTGTVLGMLDGKFLCIPEKTRMNGNLAVYGASGSMKTRSFCMNRILQSAVRGESLIICDPKSELYEKSSEYMRDLGYTVRVFNLVSPENSDSWNCLKEIEGQELMAQLFVDVIIKNTNGTGKSDRFWDSGEMNLLKALVLYVDLTYPPEQRTIGEVYNLITQCSESQLDSLFDVLPLTHPAKAPYSLYQRASDSVRSGVISGLGSRLQVFQSDLIKKITAYDEISLELPGQQPCAYYLVTSDQDSTFDFLASLFLSFAFIKLVRYADANCPGGRLPVPVHVLGEELTACGTISELSRRIIIFRSDDPKVNVPKWCPKRRVPPTLRIYHFRSPEIEAGESMLAANGISFFPYPSRYAVRYEGESPYTAMDFARQIKKRPLAELLSMQLLPYEILEVDDGIRPYCFLVERLGHVRCIRFKSDIARESKYEESGGKAI